jgi:translation initiation factor IF-3
LASCGVHLPQHAKEAAISSFFRVRVNEKIRAREVRLIDADGRQVGIVPTPEALKRARQAGLDLVEISAEAQPPVCRVLDFGKYRYEMSKRERESRKHQTGSRMKELQFHANIDPHDLEIKLNHAREFLQKAMRVRCTLKFRGREMAHIEFGQQIMDKIIKGCEDFGRVEVPPRMMGRTISMMLAPRKASGRNSPQSAASSRRLPEASVTPPAPMPQSLQRPQQLAINPVLGDDFKLPPSNPPKKA